MYWYVDENTGARRRKMAPIQAPADARPRLAQPLCWDQLFSLSFRGEEPGYGSEVEELKRSSENVDAHNNNVNKFAIFRCAACAACQGKVVLLKKWASRMASSISRNIYTPRYGRDPVMQS